MELINHFIPSYGYLAVFRTTVVRAHARQPAAA